MREKYLNKKFFCSVFSRFCTEYGNLRNKVPYSIRIWENTDKEKLLSIYCREIDIFNGLKTFGRVQLLFDNEKIVLYCYLERNSLALFNHRTILSRKSFLQSLRNILVVWYVIWIIFLCRVDSVILNRKEEGFVFSHLMIICTGFHDCRNKYFQLHQPNSKWKVVTIG